MSPKYVNKKERQQQILTAAAQVFAQFGYQRSTIDQIAEASGYAKGTLYLYFKSKEDLFFALFESFTQGFNPRETKQKGSPLKQAQQFILNIAEALDQNEDLIPLTLEFWSVCGIADTRKRFGEHYAAILQQYREPLISLLHEAKNAGELHPELSETAVASALLALIDGLLIQQWTDPSIRVHKVLKHSLPFLLSPYKSAFMG